MIRLNHFHHSTSQRESGSCLEYNIIRVSFVSRNSTGLTKLKGGLTLRV